MSTPRDYTVSLVIATPFELPARGKFVGIISAPSSAIDVSIDGGSDLRRAAGGSILVGDFFSRIRLTSVATQTARVLIADEVQDVSDAASGGSSGTTSTSDVPSSTVATPDDNPIAAATTENIAANAARRRITIGNMSNSADAIRVQAVGAVDLSGVEIVPGMSYRFDTTASLDIRCNGATGATYWILEESGP